MNVSSTQIREALKLRFEPASHALMFGLSGKSGWRKP